jgi:hypothetical protein
MRDKLLKITSRFQVPSLLPGSDFPPENRALPLDADRQHLENAVRRNSNRQCAMRRDWRLAA